ncbi:AraC family transcriptional regulator [Lachnoclostridium pacaense]|uniref:AraC family transcriptional regulator n=1 Tax=Enterocloster hominis (ex Hitch et al. 2024) TaxID=1917870 RepID=UPI001D118E47|nr:AraC family transcriptional regulator [Lachnoclostridium pacaense]MCC2816099.1 AraC family transcriptional regulator [Lachnoclostridium pacaense]
MAKIVPMQSLYCSMQDENKICSFDIEVLTGPTTPLIHPMSRFWLVNSGKGTLMLNNRPYDLKPGAVVCVLPWQISDIVEVESPIQFFVMAYYFDNINEIIKTFYNPGNEPLSIIQTLSANPVLYLEGEALASMQKLFLQIKGEIGMESTMEIGTEPAVESGMETAVESGMESVMKSDMKSAPKSVADMPQDPPIHPSAASCPPSQELSNLYITNKLIEIIIHFLRAKKAASLPPSARIIEPSEIFQYLYSHLNEKITLSMLSQIFYMSESSISAYITRTTGLSFFDLLNEMRIGKTINFLLYTDFTLEELAEILGFVDSAHISKVFSARVGMKANEFRATYQKVGSLCRIKDRKDFYTIVSYIYRHYSEPLNPRMVGERFHLSPRELNRILLYQVEMNFSDYLNFIRVNRASELLLLTTRSILDIALDTGYHNEKTLTRNFLKFRSMTPGKFRQAVELQEF